MAFYSLFGVSDFDFEIIGNIIILEDYFALKIKMEIELNIIISFHTLRIILKSFIHGYK